MKLMSWKPSRKLQAQQQELSQQHPIIVMSRGHSGTRVLSWICTKLGVNMGTNASLATGDANDQIFTQQIKKVAIQNLNTVHMDQIQENDLHRFQKAVYGYYSRLGTPQQSWGWKFPETYLIGPYAARTFPQALYLHLVRDGRDIAFKHHLTDDVQRRLGRKLLSRLDVLQWPHHLQAAMSWAFQVDNFDRFRPNVPSSQIFDVTFEEICLHPHEVTQRLCDFLKVPLTPDCETYLSESINPGKVSQYKENDPVLVHEVEKHIAETLKRYDYL